MTKKHGCSSRRVPLRHFPLNTEDEGIGFSIRVLCNIRFSSRQDHIGVHMLEVATQYELAQTYLEGGGTRVVVRHTQCFMQLHFSIHIRHYHNIEGQEVLTWIPDEL